MRKILTYVSKLKNPISVLLIKVELFDLRYFDKLVKEIGCQRNN